MTSSLPPDVPSEVPSDGDSRDDILERLTAADPAVGAGVDLDALRAAVDARIAAAPTSLRAPEVPRARRPARWLQIAAAVAGVAVVGTGGYALGHGGSTTPAAAPAISLVAPSVGEGAAPRVVSGQAQPGTAAAGTAAAPNMVGYGVGRVVFTAQGLSGSEATAEAWAFDAAAVFSSASAARAATALGLTGTPTLVSGAWTVGATDGSGPSLQLQPNGTASLSYYDPTKDRYSCSSSVGKGTTGSSGTTQTVPLPVSPCASAGVPAPQGDAAITRVKELLSGIGIDSGSYEYGAADTGTTDVSSVTAWQVIDGQRTGHAWSATLRADGLQGLSGELAPMVSLGRYPVVSPARAVDRLGDPRFGGSYGSIMPLTLGTATQSVQGAAAVPATTASPVAPAQAGSGTAAASPTARTVPAPSAASTLPPLPSVGSVFSWPVQRVTITKARLGLTFLTQTNGSTVLVPAYELSDSTGQSWSVLAVAEGSLDMSPLG